MLTRLDATLLGLAQKFCDRMQQITGLTKFRFEKWSLIVAMMFMWHYSLLNLIEPVHLFALCLTTLLLFRIIRTVEVCEARFLRDGELFLFGFARRESRIVILLLYTLFELLFALYGAWDLVCEFVCLVLWVYFAACIPRPPSKSKIREYYEKGLEWLRGAVGPIPTPIPVRHR